MSKKKYYYKNNHKKVEKKVENKKLTYDEIVNVRKDVSEINIEPSNYNNISVIKIIAISITILTIIICSLVLFRVI